MIALPPADRGHLALRMTAAAARGRFELQVCDSCGTTQYPPREVCGRCLCGALRWRVQSSSATLLAMTTLRHSNTAYFRERLPWKIGLVKLEAGPTIIAHVSEELDAPPCKVRVIARLDRSGQAVLIAMPEQLTSGREDKMMQEMGCDPKSRSVLITDGDSPVGRSLVRALTAAGAGKIWIGAADDGFGTDLDIVINTCDAPPEVASAETEMRINYFSLLQLTQDIAPLLERRAAAGHLCAWVNLLSIDALSNAPPRSTYAASKAAAHSFTQHLRRRLQASGIRVLGVYPEPGYAPDALAGDIVNALQDGIEDVFAGPIAQAWADAVRESPKVLERELAR